MEQWSGTTAKEGTKMEGDAVLDGIDDSLRHFKALSEALDERLKKREQQPKWEPALARKLASGPPPSRVSAGTVGAMASGDDGSVQEDGAAGSGYADSVLLAARASPVPPDTTPPRTQSQLQPQDTTRVRFRSIHGSPQSTPPCRHNAAAMSSRPAVMAASQSPTLPVRPPPPVQVSNPVPAPAADYTSLLRSTLESPRMSGAGTAAAGPTESPSRVPSRHGMITSSTSVPTVAAALAAAAAAVAAPTAVAAAASVSSPRSTATFTTYSISRQQAAAAASAAGRAGSRGRPAILPGQVQYRDLVAAAQAASHDGGARARAFHADMEEIDAEIDAYVGDYKFEQYAPDAALAVQTAWRARKVRVFFNRYCVVRWKHLQRQLALVFGPLKQLVLAVLHGRRRMLRRTFDEWRDWVFLGNELFFKLMAKLRASIGSVKEYATPQQLWQLCTPPGGDPWTARLTLGALVANVLIRQMPHRTLALYLGAWRRAVALQVAKRQKAGEVLRRMEHKRFWEYVRFLFRFWFRWSVIRVSERLKIPPPIFRPRIPEWDEWLFRHTRSRELHSRMVQLHKGFRVRHFFDFWLFFTRRNKRMREAWYSTAAHHIEAILRNAVNAFKANLAEGRRRRRVKRAVFEGILHLTRRNKTVRRIAKEVHEISLLSQRRLVFRRLREWARANRMLCTAASIQIMARRPLCLIPIYAMLDDSVHMRFMWSWNAWRNYTLGRLRMRCLLGLHLSRANTAHMEIAFKALRKWAELQRAERAREVLKQMCLPAPPHLPSPPTPSSEPTVNPAALSLEGASNMATQQGGGAAAAGVPVTNMQGSDMWPLPQLQQAQQHQLLQRVEVSSLRPSNAGSAATVSIAATITTAASAVTPVDSTASGSGDHEDERADFELFVSLADYPLPPGGTWRSPLDKAEILRRVPAFATDPAMAAAAAVAAATSGMPSTPINASISGAMTAAGSPAEVCVTGGLPAGTVPGNWITGTNLQLTGPTGAAAGPASAGASAQVQAQVPTLQYGNLQSSGQGNPQYLQYNLMAFVAKIQELLQQLLDLEGPFSAQELGKRLVLSVNPQRALTSTQRTWVEMDNPVSNIFLSQGRPDPGLWQRLVGMMVCGVPHPDDPGAHMVDQSRLPLSNRAAAIRHAALLARINLPDYASVPAAAQNENTTGAPAVSGGSASTSGGGSNGGGGGSTGGGGGSTGGAGGSTGDGGSSGGGGSSGSGSSGGAATAGGRRSGIILEEQEQDTMLLHRLCEAEDFLDTCMHVLLGLGGMETPLLRRAIGSIMPRGTLLGDALAELLQPALQADLCAMAANLRHRTHRDRIITLGVDLADKARTYASHRPEFTLTKRDRRGAAVQHVQGAVAARAAAAAAALAARLAGAGAGNSPLPATANVSLEQGVMPLTSAMAAMAAALVGPPPPGPGNSGAGAGKAAGPNDEEDMDVIRARRRAAAIAQAEATAAAVAAAAKAAVAAAAAAAAAGGGGGGVAGGGAGVGGVGAVNTVNPTPPSTADTQATPSPGGTPSRKWRPLKAAGLSKSAVIRMEMLTGKPSGNSLAHSQSPPLTPGSGATAAATGGPAAPPRTSSIPRGLRTERLPGPSPGRGMRGIGLSPANGGQAHGHDVGASAGATASLSPTDALSPTRSRMGAFGRRGSLRNQTSNVWGRGSAGAMSTRAMLAESGAFSFAVRGSELPLSPGGTPAVGKQGTGHYQGQGQQRGAGGTTLNDAPDPDGAPHSPRADTAAGGMATSSGDKHALVNNFLHMTPPGFLSAGKVLNPANFPWPRDVPSQDTVQIKADFILRATLPNLNAMPKLPDIVYGPLGDAPGTQELEPTPEPSLLSHASINSSRALTEAVAAAAAAVSGGGDSSGGGAGAGSTASANASEVLGDIPITAFGGAGGAVAAAAAAAAVAGGASGNMVWSVSGAAIGEQGNDASAASLGIGNIAAGWSRSAMSAHGGHPSGRRVGTAQRSTLSSKGLPSGGVSYPGEHKPQPRRNPSVLSSVQKMYGGSGSVALDKEAMAAALAARRERRTQLMVWQMLGQDLMQDGLVHSAPASPDPHQSLPGLAEGADGEEGEDEERSDDNELTAKVTAVSSNGLPLQDSMPAQLLRMTFESAASFKEAPEPKGIAMAFRDFSLKRKSTEGDIGSDIDSVTGGTPQTGTPGGVSGHSGDESASEPPTPDRASSVNGGGGGAAATASGGGSRLQAGGRPQFRVTTRQLNIFMGAHLRRGSSSGAKSAAWKRYRDKQRKGLTLTADGILVTPFGVQVVREVEEEGEDSDAASNRRGGSAGTGNDPASMAAAAGDGGGVTNPLADGLRRTRTVVLREFASAAPFEEQYDFKKSVWMPPDQRQFMLDDYNLAAEIASGRVGELTPPYLDQLMAPPAESPFLQEFEAELTRTRVGVQRRVQQSHPDRQRAWSRLSRGASVMSRASATGSASVSGAAAVAAGNGGRDSSDSSTTTRRRRLRRPISRYSRRRFPIAESAFLSSDEEREARGTSAATSRGGNEPHKPYVDDLFDEDYFGGINISQAAAVAAAAATAAATHEDQTILQLVRMGAPGFQMLRPIAHVPSAAAAAAAAASAAKDGLSPWSSNAPDSTAALAAVASTASRPAALLRHLSSGTGSARSAASVGARVLSRGASARAAIAAAAAAAAEASNTPAAMLQRTLALEAAIGGDVYDMEVARLPNLTEAAELLGSMFSSNGPSRPTSAKVVRPRSRVRKRGNLRTGQQLLEDPLLQLPSMLQSRAPQPQPPTAPVADGKVPSGASGSARPSRLANGTDDDDAQSEPSVSPSEAGSASSLRGEVTLAAFGARSPRRGRGGEGEADAATEQQKQEAEQHAALMRDDGVRRQLAALRAMWTSDPYSARPGVDPAGLPPPPPNLGAAAASAAAAVAMAAATAAAADGSSDTAAVAARAAAPVRIGAGLARALAEARVEQWALYDRSIEHMAKEFARAMQQLGSSGSGTGEADEDTNFMTSMYGIYGPGGSRPLRSGAFDPTRPASGSSAGPGPGSAASRRRQYDAAFHRQRGRRSSLGADDAATAQSSTSGLSTLLTGHATRGLLDTLEETLATALDPTSLTGLNLQEYDDQLSELMQRLMVAPAASKYMFWKKVQTVQQLRQRMMEDRAMAEQLRSISWADSFNAHRMAPRGTDVNTGRMGPFAAEALEYSDARHRNQLQEERRIAAVRKLRMAQARATREQRAAAAAEAAAAGGSSGGAAAAAAVPPPPQSQVVMRPELSLAPPAGGTLSQEPTPQVGRKAAGDLIGRRAAWVPLISPPPPLPLDQWNQPVEPHPVLERIVAPARLLPKHVPAGATASGRNIVPRRTWRRRRRQKSTTASIAASAASVARPRSAPRPGFRNTLMSAHPDDLNRVLDHTDDGVPLNGAVAVAGLTEGRPLWCAAAAVGGQVCTRSEPGRGGPKRRFASYYRQGRDDNDEYEDNGDEEGAGDGDDGGGQEGKDWEDKEEDDDEEEDDEEEDGEEVYSLADGTNYYRDPGTHAPEAFGDADGFTGWAASEPHRPRSQPTTKEEQRTAATDQRSNGTTVTSARRGLAMPIYMLPTASAAARTAGVPAARGSGGGWRPPQGYAQLRPGAPDLGSETQPPLSQIAGERVPTDGGAMGPDGAGGHSAGGGVEADEGYGNDGVGSAHADAARPELADGDSHHVDGDGDGDGGGPHRRAKRPRLTAAKLQLALARRAELRAQLDARGELLELDEMDLDELEEEADLVDRLVEASIRVYGAALARRTAQIDGTVAPASGALAVPGEGVLLAGRGRALGWVPQGPLALQRGDGRKLLPSDPWHNPVAGYGAAEMAARHSTVHLAPGSPLSLAGVPAGGGAAAASHLTATVRAAKPPSSLLLKAGGQDDPEHPHLPHPSGQQRPMGPPPAPLAPLATPKPFPAAYTQPGNLCFPSPVPATTSGGGALAGVAATNPLRSSAPAGLGSTLPSGALRPIRTPVTGPAGLLPLASSPNTGSGAGSSRLGSAATGDVARLPVVLQGGAMVLPTRGEHHLLPPVALPSHPSGSSSTVVPRTPRSVRGHSSTSVGGAAFRPHLEPIPDAPRPHSAGLPLSAGAGAAVAPTGQPLLQSPKAGSAGSLTAAVAAAAAKQAALNPSGSTPGAVPALDWVRARSPATGLVGLIGIGETPSIVAAAVAAGPVTGIAGAPAPSEISSPLGRNSSPSRRSLSPTRGGRGP